MHLLLWRHHLGKLWWFAYSCCGLSPRGLRSLLAMAINCLVRLLYRPTTVFISNYRFLQLYYYYKKNTFDNVMLIIINIIIIITIFSGAQSQHVQASYLEEHISLQMNRIGLKYTKVVSVAECRADLELRLLPYLYKTPQSYAICITSKGWAIIIYCSHACFIT